MPEIFAGLIRHLLTMAGAAAVSKGYIDGDTATSLAGAGTALAGVIWSVWAKRGL